SLLSPISKSGKPWPGRRGRSRAFRLFKLRNSEKGERLGEAVVEGPHGRSKIGADLLRQVDDGVAKASHYLRRRLLAYPAGVLSQRRVAPVRGAVLDPPVLPGQPQELLRVGPLPAQAGDPVDHLHRRLALLGPLTDQLKALLQALPLLRLG